MVLNWKKIEILWPLKELLKSKFNRSPTFYWPVIPWIDALSWFYIRHFKDVPSRYPLKMPANIWRFHEVLRWKRLTRVQIMFCVQDVFATITDQKTTGVYWYFAWSNSEVRNIFIKRMKMNVPCGACVHCESSQNTIFYLVEGQIIL